MSYMLDTNICIYLIKKHPLTYFERLEEIQQKNNIAISSIVLSELQYGVSKRVKGLIIENWNSY